MYPNTMVMNEFNLNTVSGTELFIDYIKFTIKKTNELKNQKQLKPQRN